MQFSFQYNGQHYKQDAKGSYKIAPELLVEVERQDFPEFNATYWMVWFSNPSERNSGIISEIQDCDTVLPIKDPPCASGCQPGKEHLCVTTMQGTVDPGFYAEGHEKAADEFHLTDEYLSKWKTAKSFENLHAYSSDGTAPFFNVHAGGRGAMVAVGWTGGWRAQFASCEEGVNVKTGLQSTHFYLKPGEKVRTSSVLIMEYEGEYSNLFRRLIRTHFSHCAQTPGRKEGLFAAEMWGGLSGEEMCRRIRKLQETGVDFEELWIDAGWSGDCKSSGSVADDTWYRCNGDWRISENIHPEKLQDVKALLDAKGQHIMLWFEPERVTRISADRVEAYHNHPEWLLENSEDEYQTLLYYGEPEALDYVYNLIASHIEALDIACYRQDCNLSSLAKYFRKYETEDRRGIMEIKHICGVYQLFDRLRERFPKLLIDNCASGGRRIDIEMLRRSIAFFRSDYLCNFNPTPEIIQAHQTNAAVYLPYIGAGIKTKSDTYAVRSAYAASFGFMCYSSIIQTMDKQDMEWAAAISREYLSIREYFSKDFYNHGSKKADLSSWAIWQYHDPDTQSGIVMAFRRPESPFSQANLQLEGLEAGRDYIFEVLDDGSSFRSESSLTVSLQKPRSSVILRYRPV